MYSLKQMSCVQWRLLWFGTVPVTLSILHWTDFITIGPLEQVKAFILFCALFAAWMVTKHIDERSGPPIK